MAVACQYRETGDLMQMQCVRTAIARLEFELAKQSRRRTL